MNHRPPGRSRLWWVAEIIASGGYALIEPLPETGVMDVQSGWQRASTVDAEELARLIGNIMCIHDCAACGNCMKRARVAAHQVRAHFLALEEAADAR